MWWLGQSPDHHISGSLLRARGSCITLLVGAGGFLEMMRDVDGGLLERAGGHRVALTSLHTTWRGWLPAHNDPGVRRQAGGMFPPDGLTHLGLTLEARRQPFHRACSWGC